MITRTAIGVRVRIKRRKTLRKLIVNSKCRYYGIQHCWRIQPGVFCNQLAHVGGEVEDVVKFEIIGVSCDDVVQTIAILVLMTLKAWLMWSRSKLFFLDFGLQYRLHTAIFFILLSLVVFFGEIIAHVASTPHGISMRDCVKFLT